MAAAVLAGSMAFTGGSIGAGSASLGGASPTGVNSTVGQPLKAHKIDSKQAARKGNAAESWRRMGMRRLRRTSESRLNCVAHSFGKVREFFLHTPCRSLDRALFGVTDGNGNVAAVSMAWVTMRSRSQAREFRRVIDIHGSGDIIPLAGTLLKTYGVRFTGLSYDSLSRGRTSVIAETETASGHFSSEALDAIAEVAALLPLQGFSR